jgi:hypothetical protein
MNCGVGAFPAASCLLPTEAFPPIKSCRGLVLLENPRAAAILAFHGTIERKEPSARASPSSGPIVLSS